MRQNARARSFQGAAITIRAASIVALAACSAHGAPRADQPRALPGFSLSLPSGTVLDDKSSDYGKGSYSVGIKGSWVVTIEWGPGPLARSDRTAYHDAWQLDFDHPLPIHAPNVPSETFVGTNHGPARVTFVTCGHRYVAIASIAHDGVAALQAAVVATFRCAPDAEREREVAVRIDLADRAGWERVGERTDVVPLVRDGGNKLVLALYYAHEPDKATLDHLVSGYHGTLGDGDPRPLTAPSVRGWVRTVTCSPTNWVAVLYVEAGSGAAARDTIDGVRCLKPGEPDVTWPPASAEVQQTLKALSE